MYDRNGGRLPCAADGTFFSSRMEQEVTMVVKKCPSCKNVVSWESYCCPRCGIEFRTLRRRRILLLLSLAALVAWIVHKYFTR